jgi:acetylornithine deacetylase/succinyl-diaminopimelate desuccinylase-like protein
LVLECEEETDSAHLTALLNAASDIIGTPDYLFCLDSGLVDYDHMWLTTSLRGYCSFDLTVQAAV